MSSDNSQNIKRKNRKRKKTFLQKAVKNVKRSNYGKSLLNDYMSEEDYKYLVQMLEIGKKGFDSDLDKDSFVNNILKHIENKEIEYAKNQLGSRAMEMILSLADNDALAKLTETFGDDVRLLLKHRFASFVLQKFVKICYEKIQKLNSSTYKTCFEKFIVKISKFQLNNLDEYIFDRFGNHVIRTCLESLAGSNTPAFTEIVEDYANRILRWPQFKELCTTEITSGLLQILLKSLKLVNKETLNEFIDKLLKDIFIEENSNKISCAFMSKSLLMLLETCLEVATVDQFDIIVEQLFKGKMLQLALLKECSFAVQKVFSFCTKKDQFEVLFDELDPNFVDIIIQGYSGIILKIGETCKRLEAKQGAFIKSVMKGLNCFTPDTYQQHFILALCRFKPYTLNESVSNDNLAKERLSHDGTLIVQLMLNFKKPIKIVNYILEMEQDSLTNLFSNKYGSYIADTYFNSQSVGEKSREKLIRKMQGTYQELAADKFGSRTFEAIWKASNIKMKCIIMKELTEKGGLWQNTLHGNLIVAKIQLQLYKENIEKWKRSIEKS